MRDRAHTQPIPFAVRKRILFSSDPRPSARRRNTLHFYGCGGSITFASMNLVTAFGKSAQSHPKKAAVFWGDEEFSYGLLFAQTALAAERLQSLGVKGSGFARWRAKISWISSRM